MNENFSKGDLLRRISKSYTKIYEYISSLNHHQLIEMKDKAGWNVKDFIIHLAVWEDGVTQLLQKGKRSDGMGIPEDVFHRDSMDEINALIRSQNENITEQDAIIKFATSHSRLINEVEKLSEDDLMRPYNHFDPTFKSSKPVIGWIIGNTYEHFDPHLKKIKNMVDLDQA